MVDRWLLYFNTIRYLKPGQVFWRVWRKLPPFLASAAGPAPALRRSDQPFAPFPRKRPSLIGPDAFRLLNREGRVQSAADWNDPQADALWLYNLHYFDDLCAVGAEARREWHQALIARWIAENPIGHGVGWDPYPLSLRIVNWIKWALSGGGVNPGRGAPERDPLGRGFSAPAIQSLAIQARYLASRVEWHLLGNHVLANAKALVFAGCFFEGAEAKDWLNDGLAILRAQLAEQVLPDGGHFERSPMYHAIVLEDLLDLINLSLCFRDALPADRVQSLRGAAARMLGWASVMTHPDGGIAFFNDAAFGIAPDVAELERYAGRLGIAPIRNADTRLLHLAQSGYLRLAQGPFTMLFDAAPVGPDYLPGHAHADTLSFELSHAAQRVICNSGTSRYGHSEMRHWERSTAAHNTVEIDGENSSEVWDGFRVARRAYPLGLNSTADAKMLRATCAHDGYARLRGRPMHRRAIEVSDGAVRWTDEVSGEGAHRVVGRIPLHPSVRAERVGESAWKLMLPSGEGLVLSAADVALDEEPGRYSPEFGMTLERQVLVWVAKGPLPVSVTIQLSGSA
jgi:uncharacterized heparinase superfamily protein